MSLTAPRRAQFRLRTVLAAALATTLAVTLLAAPSTAAAVTTAATTTAAPALTASTPSAPALALKKKARITLKRSATSQIKGVKGVKLAIKVRAGGKRVAGKARIYVSGKRIKTVPVRKGSATYRLPKNIKAGTRTVTVKFFPSASHKATVSTATKRTKIRIRTKGQTIVQTALRYRGVSYRSGGTSPRGFDCSGFTQYVIEKATGEDIARTSSEQRREGKTVSRKNAKPGDLIWTPGHVAIYLGGNKQIDAPRPGKTIQVRSIWQSNPRFIRI